MSVLFKGVYYYSDFPLNEHTIQGSTLIKGAYYLRKYGSGKMKLLLVYYIQEIRLYLEIAQATHIYNYSVISLTV